MNRLITANAQQAAPAGKVNGAHSHMGKVYCPMCTHTVEAEIQHAGKRVFVKDGQKCPRCSASLDAGYIFHMDRAA